MSNHSWIIEAIEKSKGVSEIAVYYKDGEFRFYDGGFWLKVIRFISKIAGGNKSYCKVSELPRTGDTEGEYTDYPLITPEKGKLETFNFIKTEKKDG
jgi:hypothetical protein